jgi:hypothetical protein
MANSGTSEAQGTELDEDLSDKDSTISAEDINTQITKWKPVTPTNLFGGCEFLSLRLPSTEIDVEDRWRHWLKLRRMSGLMMEQLKLVLTRSIMVSSDSC